MRILVAQLGARRHYAIPAMLERAGVLELLYTDLWAGTGVLPALEWLWPEGLQPAGLRKVLGRQVPGVPGGKIRSFAGLAVRRVLGRTRAGGSPYAAWLRANREFCVGVAARGFGGADTVYVFNGAGLEILERARDQGLRTIVEQTDAPVEVEESLLAAERERWPDWETGRPGRSDWGPMAERERREWELADVVLCGSEYVREGVALAEGPVEACRVVPYGVQLTKSGAPSPPAPLPGRERGEEGRLRVLFVGTLCLRKGVPYLLEAARVLGENVDVRAVGPNRLTQSATSRLSEWVDVRGPVPRSEIESQFEWADVFVLPTISEGSANVCYEALASGLPVITTPNAGSVVRDGVDGFVVPIRNAAAIVERVEEFSEDRERLKRMSRKALERSLEFTWDKYEERLLGAIGEGRGESSEVRGKEAAVC